MKLKPGQLIRYRIFKNGREYFAKVADIEEIQQKNKSVNIVSLDGIGLPKKIQFPVENLKEVKFYRSMDDLEKDFPRSIYSNLKAVLHPHYLDKTGS